MANIPLRKTISVIKINNEFIERFAQQDISFSVTIFHII